MKSDPGIKDLVETTPDGKKVIMSAEDFSRLVRYVNELQDANDKLNAQIEEYNMRFANVEED